MTARVMTAPSVAMTSAERGVWTQSALLAVAAHVALGTALWMMARPPLPVVDEPIVLIELPADAAPAVSAASAEPVAAQTATPTVVAPVPVTPSAPIVPMPVAKAAPSPVAQPVTASPIATAAPAQQPSASTPSSSAAPAATARTDTPTKAAESGAGIGAVTGGDPRAKKVEADYFALVSAHLNRRKQYPAEARQARQEGIVTVRFTIARSGQVSDVAIKRSGGHAILDQATLELVRRVAPLPAIPASLGRDALSVALPISYTLRTR